MNINKELKTQFEDLIGEIKIKNINNTILLSGNVYVSEIDLFKEVLIKKISQKYPGMLMSNALKINEFSVIEDKVENNYENESILDEINILYYGYLDVDHIKPNDEFKIIHENNRDKLDNIVRVLNFISPIVLNSDLKIIDGNFRLQLAKTNNIKRVLVVVIDDNDKRADFLRLALNRTAEFQRWAYREVDDFVDSIPQVQPLLEPIGFFGKYVLPTSFFSETVTKYIIDPFNEKQKQYSQEEGLAEWAKYRREQMAKLSEEKRSKQPKPVNAISLFDLTPKKEDFVQTYDIEEEMDVFVDKYKEIAGDITDRSDAIKKAEILKKGGLWQNKHRSSSEVAEENRLLAIEEIQNSNILTEEEKIEVVENIDNYAEHINNIKELAKKLRGVE
ncbi:MAG TPA: hypothetical protein GXZ90_08645 [Clostridiales bacterium]|nr:hypothetical protein [Clostridiales bacterium]